MVIIPKVFHRVWFGPQPIPPPFRDWGYSWMDHHPGWSMTTWYEGTYLPTNIRDLIARCPNYSQMSDVLRYYILSQFGGVYIDTDFQCLRNIEPLIEGASAFAAWQLDDHGAEGAVAAGICGAVSGHPLFKSLVDGLSDQDVGKFRSIGPAYFTRRVRGGFDIRILEREHFYPYSWTELDRRNENFPNSFAVHHWAGKWYKDSFMRRIPRENTEDRQQKTEVEKK